MTGNPIEQAEEEHSGGESEEYSFEEFLDHARENPKAVTNSVQYVVNAIEHFGTRDVVEYGETKERYRFFDDPTNDGEHAVLGNTDELNSFVNSLKRKASIDGENNRILWFTGPTATGKSELKRCLLNGIQAYARTHEGRRYTVKWSIDSLSKSGMTYGDGTGATEDRDWYQSPVHVNPLAVLPEETRKSFISELNEESGIDVTFDGELDPFSREAYEILEQRYDTFSEIVSDDHLKVVSYVPDIGEGFGLLQTEDVGNPKQKIVGSWMQNSMKQYVKKGGKDAQYFTYDGLISQGNSLISVIEDAQHHAEAFAKLMNVSEDDVVKLDNKITMHVDTLIIAISNPDFQAALRQHQEAEASDPNKALRRRLERYDFEYLTSVLLETQLLVKHLTSGSVFWDDVEVEDIDEKISLSIEKYGTHFSPHAVEAAAYYDVLTRISNGEVGKRNKIFYYDRGYSVSNDRRIDYTEDELTSSLDGRRGIPVTYTENVLSELAQSSEGPIMPKDVVQTMSDSLPESPVFSESEQSDYRMDKADAMTYINQRIEKDVLNAIIGDSDVSKEEVHEYVDSLFSWEEDDEDNFDPYELREFEKSYFGMDGGRYSSDALPSPKIKKFRKQKIIKPINKYIYDHKDDYDPENIPIEECQTVRSLLEDDSWDRVEQLYDNLDLFVWDDPRSDTQTEEVKEHTIENMKEMGYTEESAKKASSRIIKERGEITNGS